jgi:rhamnogalacturonyl hydrolase YesR
MPTPSTNQFGTYLPTKKVDFDQSLQPEFIDETKQKAQDMFDLRVHKKGLNYHGYDSKRMQQEHKEIDEAMAKH